MLRVRELSVRFQTARGWLTAVDGVSFDLERGDSLALIGASGSGKTTLLLSLSRLLPPNTCVAGRIELCGRDVLRATTRELVALRGSQLSMVFHDPLQALNPVLRIGAQISERGREDASRLLRTVGLAPEIANRYPHELSGGMRQRALIAVALAGQPSILVADEPTSSLDAAAQGGIVDLLCTLRKERQISLIVATHDPSLAARLCDRVAVLRSGRIVELGPIARLTTRPQEPPQRRPLTPSSPLLRVRGLSVDRGTRRVLESISFELQCGESLGVIGESGSGKTTLARAIARLIPAAAGTVLWNGVDLRRLGSRELRAVRKDIQLVFQDPASSLDPRATVEEILAEPLEVHGIAGDRRSKAVELLHQVRLSPEMLSRHPHELSGGQAQRVALARALATRPSLLIADEAFSALDVELKAEMARLLLDLQQSLGLTSIVITHDLRLAELLCTRIAVLEGGTLRERGASVGFRSDDRQLA